MDKITVGSINVDTSRHAGSVEQTHNTRSGILFAAMGLHVVANLMIDRLPDNGATQRVFAEDGGSSASSVLSADHPPQPKEN